MDKAFLQWFFDRVEPYREVPPDKLTAEREAAERVEEHNRNYSDFLTNAVFPNTEKLVQFLTGHRIVHRVTTWGNQLSIRVHMAWRWGELVITQSHEDAMSFEHHIITEGEKRSDDHAEDTVHQYDLHDPVPPIIAQQELAFFLSRLVQDLVEDEEPDVPLGE